MIRIVQFKYKHRRLVLAGVYGYLVTGGDLSITLSMVFERGGRSLSVSGVNTSSTWEICMKKHQIVALYIYSSLTGHISWFILSIFLFLNMLLETSFLFYLVSKTNNLNNSFIDDIWVKINALSSTNLSIKKTKKKRHPKIKQHNKLNN